jgi:hypothetical protein
MLGLLDFVVHGTGSSQIRRLCRLFSENPQKDFLPQKVPPTIRLLPAFLASQGL